MITVLIADDEEPARLRLRHLLSTIEHGLKIEAFYEASDGEETLRLLKQHASIDVLFLDIQMPVHTGFEVLERLPEHRRPYVVFTTAFNEYALQAFEANALDYLTKPIGRDRMAQSLRRIGATLENDRLRDEQQRRLDALMTWMNTQQPDAPSSTETPAQAPLTKLSIPHRDKLLLIDAGDIVSAEVTDGVTKLYVYTNDGSPHQERLRAYIVSYTLDQLEARLSPETFARVHRSALVNVDHIEAMVAWFSGRYKLMLKGQHEVIASRDRSRLLKERFTL
ncbi:MAG: LytTR family transcriptional regulator DNA-binding domain-containing protein [Rhodothermales bacterium]